MCSQPSWPRRWLRLLSAATLIATAPAQNGPDDWLAGGYHGNTKTSLQVGFGPLRMPSQGTGQTLRLGLEPRAPSTLGAGQLEVDSTATLANTWSYRPGEYRLDYESLMSTVSMQYGVSDRLEAQLDLRLFNRFGGVLDGFIHDFHRWFGLSNQGSNQFPNEENVIQLSPTASTPAIDVEESGVWQRDVSLTLLHTLSDGSGGWPAISGSITGRLDTGGDNDISGPSPLSFGISVSAAQRLIGGVYVYGGVSYARHGKDEWLGLALHRDQVAWLGALEWHVGQRTSLVAQFLRSQAVALAPRPLDLPSNELAWGIEHELASGAVFEFGMLENLAPFDAGPDFGLHVGLRFRF